MIEINLLPKDFQKKSLDFSLGKTGMYAIAAAAGVVLMLIGVTVYQNYQLASLDENIEKARQRAIMLQKDIQLVDGLTDVKNKIQQRMAAVEKLDSHRSAYVRILEDLAGNVPEFVWLSRFEEIPKEPTPDKSKKQNQADQKSAEQQQSTPQSDQSIPTVRNGEVEGFAFTLNALASFMIKMMRSDYFEDVELKLTSEMELEQKKAYNFVLSFNVHYLSDEELRNLIAASEENHTAKQAEASHKSLN